MWDKEERKKVSFLFMFHLILFKTINVEHERRVYVSPRCVFYIVSFELSDLINFTAIADVVLIFLGPLQ